MSTTKTSGWMTRLVTPMVVAALFAFTMAARADDPAVVRLSYVSGTVQVLGADGSATDQAVVNLPLFEANTVTTSADGRAEIEFADGSVARLTPNSSLQLTHLQKLGTGAHTDLTMISGLAYFELNVGQGQRFTLRVDAMKLRPVENSVFRINLDQAPDVAVFEGGLHVDNADGPTTEVNASESLRLDPSNGSRYFLTEEIAPDSWDHWNQDRDAEIAQMAESSTDVRDESGAPYDPGWNDLDAYGNWYPVEGYGNVWAPADVGVDWDPFGYGYWGNYPGVGVTWISGYPWGWLPYHCGAWNYFPFGWGWVPGGCGLGWSPVGTVWNEPAGYRLPVWPKAVFPVAGNNHAPHRHPLVPVDRGAAARGPWGPEAGGSGAGQLARVHNMHTEPLRYDGNVVQPLQRTPNPWQGKMSSGGSSLPASHVGVPVPAPGSPRGPSGFRPGFNGSETPTNSGPRGVVRPTYSAPAAPPAVRSGPAPAPAAPPAVHSAPAPAPAAPAGRPH